MSRAMTCFAAARYTYSCRYIILFDQNPTRDTPPTKQRYLYNNMCLSSLFSILFCFLSFRYNPVTNNHSSFDNYTATRLYNTHVVAYLMHFDEYRHNQIQYNQKWRLKSYKLAQTLGAFAISVSHHIIEDINLYYIEI